jgi:transposase
MFSSIDESGEEQPEESKPINIADCYNLKEVQTTFGVSESTIRQLIIRNKIPKIRKGKFAYVPKSIIENLLMKSI